MKKVPKMTKFREKSKFGETIFYSHFSQIAVTVIRYATNEKYKLTLHLVKCLELNYKE